MELEKVNVAIGGDSTELVREIDRAMAALQGLKSAAASVGSGATGGTKALEDGLEAVTQDATKADAALDRLSAAVKGADGGMDQLAAAIRAAGVALDGTEDDAIRLGATLNKAQTDARATGAAFQKMGTDARQGMTPMATEAGRAQTAMANLRVSVEQTAQATNRLAAIHVFGNNPGSDTAKRGADVAAYGKALDDLRAKYNPLFAAQQRMEAELEDINRALRVGAISEAEYANAINRTKVAFDQQARSVGVAQAAVNRAAGATKGHTQEIKLQSHQMTNLAAQMQDVVVSLGSGQSPFIVMLQQGPQATSAVGGVSNAIALLRQTINPTMVAVVALGAAFLLVTGRAFANEQSLRQVGVALDVTARGATLSRNEIDKLVDTMAELPGVTRSAAREMALLFARNPTIGPETFRLLAENVADFAAAMGVDAVTGAKMLDKAMESPSANIVKLDERFRRLTVAQYENIRAMEASGNRAGAQAEAMRLLSSWTEGAATKIQGPLTRAINDLKDAWDGLLDSLADSTIIQTVVTGLTAILNTIRAINDLKVKVTVPEPVGKAMLALGIGTPVANVDDGGLGNLTNELDEAQTKLDRIKSSIANIGKPVSADDAQSLRILNEVLEEQAQIVVDLTERVATLTANRVADTAAAAGQVHALDGIPVAGNAPAKSEFTAEQTLGAINQYDAYGAQLVKLKDDAAILEAGLISLKASIAAGGEEAKVASDLYARNARALAVNKEQQTSLMTASQLAVEQARAEQRIAQAAIGQREQVAAQERARLAVLGMVGSAEEKRAAQAAMTSAAIAQLKAAADDELSTLKLEVIGAQEVAEAWKNGAAAANLATISAQARNRAIQSGLKDEKALAAELLKQASATGLGQANRAVQELDAQLEAQKRLTEATGKGKDALAEAALANDVAAFAVKAHATAQGEDVEKTEEAITAYRDKKRAILELKQETEKQTAVTKALNEATLAGARAQAASISDAAQRRAAELAIERMEKIIELTEEWGNVSEGAGKKILDAFDATQASKEVERYYNDIRDKAEGYADDVADFLVDGFVNAAEGGKKTFDEMMDGVFAAGKRMIANLIAEWAKQQIILPVMTSIVGSMPNMLGITSPQSPAGAIAGQIGMSSGVMGDFGSLGRSLLGMGGPSGGAGFMQGILDTPIWGSGGSAGSVMSGSYQAASNAFWDVPGAAVSSAGVTGGMTIGQGLPFVGAGLSIANAVQNPNVGSIAGAVATTGGAMAGAGMFGAGMMALGPYGMIAGAILSILGNTLFKQKPSNKGAEYAFNMDENFTTAYEGTKHPDQMEFVKNFAKPIQSTIGDLESLYGVTRNSGGVAGINYGIKEGSSLYYGRAEDGIEGRTQFKFDPENEEELQKAIQGFAVAFLKDSEWTSYGEEIGKFIGEHLSKSTAETVEELLADVSWLASYEQTIETFRSGTIDLTKNLQLVNENLGKADAKAMVSSIDDFRSKVEQFGLSTEESDAALRDMIERMAGMKEEIQYTGSGLTQLEQGAVRITAKWEGMTGVLEELGYTTAQVSDIIRNGITNDIAALGYQLQVLGNIAQAQAVAMVTGQQYIPLSGSELVGNAAGSNPGFQQLGQGLAPTFVATVDALLAQARAGTLTEAAMLNFVNTNVANQREYDRFTDAELNAIVGGVVAAYNAQQQNRPGETSGIPTNTGGGGFGVDVPDDGTSSGGGGSGGGSDGGATDALRDLADAARDAERGARSLSDAWWRLANSLKDARMALGSDPNVSPHTLQDIYNTAQADFEEALATANSGTGKEAQEAASRLPELQRRYLEVSELLYGSTNKYLEDFNRTQAQVLGIETKAFDVADAQLAIAEQQLAALNEIEDKLDAIQAASGGGSSVGGGGGGGGSIGGGSGTPSLPNPGRNWGSAANVAANKQLAVATGYTGDFTGAPGGGFDTWIKTQSATVKALAADVMFANNMANRISWYNMGTNEANHADNLEIMRVTGYRGDFGGDNFQKWIVGQPEGVKEAARQVLRASNNIDRIAFLEGGWVDPSLGGTPGVDSIAAAVAPNEYVISGRAVNRYGRSALDAINAGHAPLHQGRDPALTELVAQAASDKVVILSEVRDMRRAMEKRDNQIASIAASIDSMARRGAGYGGRG